MKTLGAHLSKTEPNFVLIELPLDQNLAQSLILTESVMSYDFK